MKYFIDFEATQYTNEIISIGCIREDGAIFSSLVRPTHKLTKFITALTGITNEQLDNAQPIEIVARQFGEHFQIDLTEDIFYTYGSGDKDFLDGTIHYTTDVYARTVLESIKHCIKDYSEEVKAFFGMTHNVAMKKVAMFLSGEEIEQKHDAFEDAQMLCDIYESLQTAEPPAECPFPKHDNTPSDKPRQHSKPRNFMATHVANGNVQYFTSIEDAAQKKLKGDKNANEKTHARVVGRITNAIQNDVIYCNCRWEKLQLP